MLYIIVMFLSSHTTALSFDIYADIERDKEENNKWEKQNFVHMKYNNISKI
jgi:hypothetical protein